MKKYLKPEVAAYQFIPERGFAESDIPDNIPGADKDSILDYDNGGDAW